MATTETYLGIKIDYSRDQLIPDQGLALLTGKGFYKKEHEVSPQQSFARAATCYSFGDYKFAQRIYDAASKKWFTFASPVLSNAVEVVWPEFEESQFTKAAKWLSKHVEPDGMPISCFLSMIGDSRRELVETRKETSWLSMMGGGIGVYAGNRSPDNKSTGVMAHLRGYDADTLAYKQTASRRGSMAAYMDIDHPEITSFIQMRNPVGGDQNKKCFNLNNGVMITDKFMKQVIRGEQYELVDPKHGPTGRFLDAREVFESIMETRYETGEPFIAFSDTINRMIPKCITNGAYQVLQSNLCSEITLMTSKDRTAVCCLSSLNLDKYDEWKDTNLVQDLIRLLDNVLEYFIQLAPSELKRAVFSAKKERALGLGTLGFHSYLQRHMIPFESTGFGSAEHLNRVIYKNIREKAEKESLRLGKLRGEPDDCKGSGRRNSHLLAIAPNASSSSLVNVSPSIEPWSAVAFNAQGRAGSFLVRNEYFEEILEKLGYNTPDVWKSIIEHGGSVQHLDFLDSLTKQVFKTAREIAPESCVVLAAGRQKNICQSQSLNLFITSNITKQRLVDLHILGWKLGVKTFYYLRSEPATRAKLGTGGSKPLNSVPVKTEYETCTACEA